MKTRQEIKIVFEFFCKMWGKAHTIQKIKYPIEINVRRLLLPFIVGVILRITWFIINPHTICWDELEYHSIATRLAEGGLYGLPLAAPGWSLILGFLYWVFGANEIVGFAFNTIASIATIALVGLISWRVFGIKTAEISMWFLSLMPSYIVSGGLDIYQVSLQAFLVLVIWIGFLREWSWVSTITIGLLVGVVALIRPFWLVLPILFYIGAVLIKAQKPDLLRLCFAQAIAVFIVAAWIGTISLENGRFIPISLNATLNYWMVNNPNATGTHVAPPSEYFNPENESIVREEAMEYAKAHPFRSLELIPAKLWFMFNKEALINWVFQSTRFAIPEYLIKLTYTLANVSYWFILSCSLFVSLFLLFRRRFTELLLMGLFFYNTLAYMPFTGQLVYRWPVQFILIIYASFAIEQLMGNLGKLIFRTNVISST